jgi:hypothetical protein
MNDRDADENGGRRGDGSRYASLSALVRLEEQVRYIALTVARHEEILVALTTIPGKVDQVAQELAIVRTDLNQRFTELARQSKEDTQVRVQRWSLMLGGIGALSTISGILYAVTHALGGH